MVISGLEAIGRDVQSEESVQCLVIGWLVGGPSLFFFFKDEQVEEGLSLPDKADYL